MCVLSFVRFLTSSFFSKLSIRSFFDARLARVYLFWLGRYNTCRERETATDELKQHARRRNVGDEGPRWHTDAHLSVALLPHLAVRLHAEITVAHSSLHHLHLGRQYRLRLFVINGHLIYFKHCNTSTEYCVKR